MQDSAPDRTRQRFLSVFGNGNRRIGIWIGRRCNVRDSTAAHLAGGNEDRLPNLSRLGTSRV
jgi:hypothetical protein